MASKKSKVLAIAFCAAVMAGIHVNPVLAYYGDEDFNYQHNNTTESGLNNPEIHHTVDKGGYWDNNGTWWDPSDDEYVPDWQPVHPEGDVKCEEEVANSNITVGDMNKVTADLVANDEKIYSDVKDLQEQVNKIGTTADTDTHVKEGAATVDENGNVTMDIVDKNGNDTGKDVTITGLASDSELKEETQNRTDADTKLQKQINNNATAIGNEADARQEADAAHDQAISDLEVKNDKQDSAIAGLDAQLQEEADARQEADAAHDQAISDLEVKNDKQDSAIAGLDVQLQEEADARQEADAAHDQAISDLEVENDKQDSAIAGLDVQLKEETDARKDADADLQADINAKEEQSKDRDAQLQADIDAEEQARKDADDALQADINAKEEQSKDRDEQLQANIDAEEQARKDADDALQADINAKEEQSKYRDEQLQQSIDIQREVIGADSTEDLQNAYRGTNYISDAENMVDADRKLDAAISDVNSRVDGIENRVDGLEDRIDKVGAMSAAIANLRTMGYDPAAPTEVAVGVGQYRDETGMALGLFHYPNRDFMLSLSVSTSGDEYMGGIGATWKFGRKSPEKVAEIKKAQAEADARRAEEQKLAKAEEMKKAAKEAKVQAQMERHAKLAAERAALEEA